MTPVILGSDIHDMRRAVGLSQQGLARAMHISAGRIKAWEAERPFMPDHYVRQFLDVIMARMADREELMELKIITRTQVLPTQPFVPLPRSVFGLPHDLHPSSSTA